MRDREAPRDRAAPVVGDEREPRVAKGVRERADVGDKMPRLVGLHALRLAGKVVAALVRRHRQPAAPELDELRAPRVPELGKSVQEENERTAARGGVVQPDAVRVGVVVSDLRRLQHGPRAHWTTRSPM